MEEKDSEIQISDSFVIVRYIQEVNIETNTIEEYQEIRGQKGKSLLEISLENQIPHVHACGGNGKCSTCRVMVLKGEENLTPPNQIELELSKKKGFGKKIRLACQTQAKGDITIKRLVRDEIDEEIALSNQNTGREVSVAILFSDIRSFTDFAERHLTYDVVHILNRFYKKMGDAIINHDGYIDKFMGDGILALFGIYDKDNQKKCYDAFCAALKMLRNLQDFNYYLKKNFNEQFRIGIGLHFGTAIVGDMGHPEKMQLTAIGDSVNFASRLEKLTKKVSSPILASDDFIKVLSLSHLTLKPLKTRIRGKTGYYTIYSVEAEENLYPSIRSLIKEHLTKSIAPSVLRLVFHDVMSGGSFTSNFDDEYQLELEMEKEENRNLEKSVKFIKKIKEIVKDEPYSYRDILYLSGAVAVEITGGPYINIVIPSFSDKSFIEIGIPDENESFESYFYKFQQLGLNKQDVTALMGAHTLGKAYNQPFTEDLFTFSNQFYKRLAKQEKHIPSLHTLLPTDWELLKDKECKRFVELYAMDEKQFFEDFKSAYIKMIRFAY